MADYDTITCPRCDGIITAAPKAWGMVVVRTLAPRERAHSGAAMWCPMCRGKVEVSRDDNGEMAA